MSAIHVRLKQNWPGNFRRTIKRDSKGKSLEVREFKPGEVVEVHPRELPFLADDLGQALQPMEWSEEFGKFRPVDLSEIDLPAMIAEIKAMPIEEEEPLAGTGEAVQEPFENPEVQKQFEPAKTKKAGKGSTDGQGTV